MQSWVASSMSRRPTRCIHTDIHCAIKAVVQSGADMAVELTGDGTVDSCLFAITAAMCAVELIPVYPMPPLNDPATDALPAPVRYPGSVLGIEIP